MRGRDRRGGRSLSRGTAGAAATDIIDHLFAELPEAMAGSARRSWRKSRHERGQPRRGDPMALAGRWRRTRASWCWARMSAGTAACSAPPTACSPASAPGCSTPGVRGPAAGLAVGLGAQRFRPVVEFQFEGFMYPAIDQLVSHAGRLRNRTRGRLSCPIVLRAPSAAASSARAPLREPRGVLRPHPGHPRRHPVLAAHRLRPAARGDPRPGSGRLPRAQADLPGAEGAARGRRRGPAARPLLRRARGPRPDARELGRPARGDARGRRSAWPARASRRR